MDNTMDKVIELIVAPLFILLMVVFGGWALASCCSLFIGFVVIPFVYLFLLCVLLMFIIVCGYIVLMGLPFLVPLVMLALPIFLLCLIF